MITLSADRLAVDRGGRRLFEHLSFTLQPGEALALTGPNGAGKTSLLRALAGLLRPAAGAVRFTGTSGDLDPAEARASALHWLGAADGLNAARSAQAELSFWSGWTPPPPTSLSRELVHSGEDSREAAGGGRPAEGGLASSTLAPLGPPLSASPTSPPQAGEKRTDRVEAALSTFGLLPQARTEVRRLSTGQRRRLALAHLIAAPRPLWLLDEPLAPLDARWRARVGELMQAHLHAGGLIVAAVHDPLPIPARQLCLEAA